MLHLITHFFLLYFLKVTIYIGYFMKLGKKKRNKKKNSYDITLSKIEYKQNCIYDIITDIGNS